MLKSSSITRSEAAVSSDRSRSRARRLLLREGGRAGRVLLLAAPGCEWPFRTREPEAPEEEGAEWEPATIVPILLTNLTNALEVQEITNYDRVFHADFVFRADPTDSTEAAQSGNADAFLGWTKTVEVTTADAIFGIAETLQLTLTETGNFPPASECLVDGCQTEHAYELRVTGAELLTLRGTVRFTYQLVGSEWTVILWSDNRESTDIPSWGWYKGQKRI